MTLPRRAAQYLRMSTEHQNYSLERQSVCNAEYAAEAGLELVVSYADAGISGLRLTGRDGLKQLLADVLGGAPGFDTVLVYDVSRWGRFQDVDQGAHYEFLCREAGVQIVYTAEPFASDGSLAATLLKQLKRAMAAEFSRDISAKMIRAHRGLKQKGFWTGGPPGYGYRRLAVTGDRRPRQQLECGEQKGYRGDRTVLIPGPPHEVETVRRIYRLFLTGLRANSIAQLLNTEGRLAQGDALWTSYRIRKVLGDEKNVGVMTGGQTEGQLGPRRRVPRAQWLRVEGAVEPLITRRIFEAAQAQVRRCKPGDTTDDDLLEELRQVLADYGRLSNATIRDHPAAHGPCFYKKRFGSLAAAYSLIGYTPSRRQAAATANALARLPDRLNLRRKEVLMDPAVAWARLEAHYARLGRVSCSTINDDPEIPGIEWYRRHFGPTPAIYARLGYTPSRAQARHIAWSAAARPKRRLGFYPAEPTGPAT